MPYKCPYAESFEKCIKHRRNGLPEYCTNCKSGIAREIILSEHREPRCGRCEIPLDNPEEIFCGQCKRLEYQEYPIQFIDYFEESEYRDNGRRRNVKHDKCTRGHIFIKENTYKDKRGNRKCLVCLNTKSMIRSERRKK